MGYNSRLARDLRIRMKVGMVVFIFLIARGMVIISEHLVQEKSVEGSCKC